MECKDGVQRVVLAFPPVLTTCCCCAGGPGIWMAVNSVFARVLIDLAFVIDGVAIAGVK